MTDLEKNELRQIIREELDKTFLINGIQFSFEAPAQAVATAGYPAYQMPASNIKLAAGAPIPQCAHLWVSCSDGFQCIRCHELKINEHPH